MSQPVAQPPPGSADAVVVSVVRSPACHFCDDAEQALTELARSYPLAVDLVDIRSARGRALVAEHRPAMSPLVLLDGVYFSAGRLPRRKLAATLHRHFADALTAPRRDLRSVG